MTVEQSPDEGSPKPGFEHILTGRIQGVFGTRGWVRVFSFTRPRENIFSYSPWRVRTNEAWETHDLIAHRKQGAALLAHLAAVDDRDAAARLIGSDLAILPEQLGPAEDGEYYWVELVGMEVRDREARDLGRVIRLYETGGHDVLLVRGSRDRLIPFVRGVYVIEVDRERRRITVDWHAED